MPERLPSLGLLGEAVLVLLHHGRRLVPMLVVSTLLWGVLSVAISRVGPQPTPANASLLLVVFAAVAVLTLPLITGAHRLVLQGQRARTGLSLHAEEGRFLLAACRMTAPALLAAVVLAALTAAGLALYRRLVGPLPVNSPGFVAAAIAAGTVLDLAMSVWLTRFLLIFPAAAIGQRLTLRQSSRLLKGNVWRLFFAFLPIYVVAWLVTTLARSLGAGFWLLSAAITGVMTPLAAVIAALLLSLTYRRLLITHQVAARARAEAEAGPDGDGGQDPGTTQSDQERTSL